MNEEHLSSDTLQALLDGMLDDEASAVARRHLRSCGKCAADFRSLQQIDAALSTLAPERAGESFTHDVLTQLGIAPPVPFLFRLVEGLAYGFGVMIVLVVMGAVFYASGVIPDSEVVETQTAISPFTQTLGSAWRNAALSVTTLLHAYAPFLIDSTNLRIGVMIIAAVVMLAVLDALMRKRLLSGH